MNLSHLELKQKNFLTVAYQRLKKSLRQFNFMTYSTLKNLQVKNQKQIKMKLNLLNF